MKKLKITYLGEEVGTFSGDNMVDAIESNFDYILKHARSGPCVLEQVWMVWNDLKDVAELHIITSGSDITINFDPIKDKPKEHIFEIVNISKSDLPERYDFEITDQEVFDPFDPKWIDNIDASYGILKGTIDYVGRYRCQSTDHATYISMLMSQPLESVNLQAYISKMLIKLQQRIPKSDKYTIKCMELIYTIYESLFGKDKPVMNDQMMSLLYYHKTISALELSGKITALKYYRKKSGKTQQEVSEEVGMSLRQYQRYEDNHSTLATAKKYVIKAIADVVGVDPNKLVSNGTVKYVNSDFEKI